MAYKAITDMVIERKASLGTKPTSLALHTCCQLSYDSKEEEDLSNGTEEVTVAKSGK
jgi:hypothetical protein